MSWKCDQRFVLCPGLSMAVVTLGGTPQSPSHPVNQSPQSPRGACMRVDGAWTSMSTLYVFTRAYLWSVCSACGCVWPGSASGSSGWSIWTHTYALSLGRWQRLAGASLRQKESLLCICPCVAAHVIPCISNNQMMLRCRSKYSCMIVVMTIWQQLQTYLLYVRTHVACRPLSGSI